MEHHTISSVIFCSSIKCSINNEIKYLSFSFDSPSYKEGAKGIHVKGLEVHKSTKNFDKCNNNMAEPVKLLLSSPS